MVLRAPATRGGLENDGNTSPWRRTSTASTWAKALKERDDACTRTILPRGCDNKAETGKAGGMSDQFETRPGGENDEEREPLDDDLVPVMGPDEGLAPEGDVAESDAVAAEDYDAEPAVESPAWVSAVTGAGLGLIAVQALVLIGTLTQSMAVPRYPGDFFHKLGVVLLSNVGSANGLALLVGALLAGLPTLLGAPVSAGARRRQALVFGIGGLLAVLLVLGTPIAVRARIHALDVGGQAVDSLARRVLATYVAGTLGTALVALAACLGLSRAGRTVTPRP